MGGRLSGGKHSRAIEWLCGGSTSPCAKDCHSVAISLHNTFAKSVVSIDRTLSKAVSSWPDSYSASVPLEIL